MCEKHAADYSFKIPPMVRITRRGHQSNHPVVISSSPTGKNMCPVDSAFKIFRNPDPDLCPGTSSLRPREP